MEVKRKHNSDDEDLRSRWRQLEQKFLQKIWYIIRSNLNKYSFVYEILSQCFIVQLSAT